MAKAAKQLKTINDLKPDPMNVNKGTERGAKVIDWSLTELGAGRSILADADGVVIAGNKTLQGAISHGLPIRVIETEGDELVVVQRKDLRLTGKGNERKRARQLAIADNRASEIGYVPDVTTLLEHIGSGVDIEAMFDEAEVKALMAGLDDRVSYELLNDDDSSNGDGHSSGQSQGNSDRYPLAIVLDLGMLRQWQQFKTEAEIDSDTRAFIYLLESHAQSK